MLLGQQLPRNIYSELWGQDQVLWHPASLEDMDGREAPLKLENGAMQLLYTGRYLEFSDELKLCPELLQHINCRFCDILDRNDLRQKHETALSDTKGKLEMSPFFLIVLTRDEGVVGRTMELIESSGLWDVAQCALFTMVDFCCSELACSTDEVQLARFFVRLSRQHEAACVRLLSVESTKDSLTPLEYAAARDRFHLASAFANAPGFLARSRPHPTDDRLLLEEIDLSCYSYRHSGTNSRYSKSPFVQLIDSSQAIIGDQIPPGHLCFFNSPVTRAYFTNIARLAPYKSLSFLSLVFYVLMYFGQLSTTTVRVFTKDTFNSSVVVLISGQANSSLSYLRLLSPSVVAAFQYVYYGRLFLQICTMVTWWLWLTVTLTNRYSRPRGLRRTWNYRKLLQGVLTMRGFVLETIISCFTLFQIVVIVLEALFFHEPNSYYEENGQWFVSPSRLMLMFVVNSSFMLTIMLMAVCKMACYYKTLFYVLYCMNASTKLVYLICLPLVLVGCTMLLSQPYVTCHSLSWTCLFEYVGRTFRYTFSLSDFPGISDYLVLWPQAVMFLCIAVFTLNFGIALLTQQIALLQENVGFRRAILVAYFSHLYATARWRLGRFLQLSSGRNLVMRRVRVRSRTGQGAAECCLR